MKRNITFGQLRDLLTGLGFEEIRRAEGVALKHLASNTVFLFRPYRENDPVKSVEVQHVRLTLDTRDLLGADTFDGLMTKAPA